MVIDSIPARSPAGIQTLMSIAIQDIEPSLPRGKISNFCDEEIGSTQSNQESHRKRTLESPQSGLGWKRLGWARLGQSRLYVL